MSNLMYLFFGLFFIFVLLGCTEPADALSEGGDSGSSGGSKSSPSETEIPSGSSSSGSSGSRFVGGGGGSSPPSCDFVDVEFDEGSGTSEDPFVVSDANHLNKVRENLSAHYVLSDNVDMNCFTWSPIGECGSKTRSFMGNFDGADFNISNLDVSLENNNGCVGFFGHLTNSNVSNLGLIDLRVGSDSTQHVGGLTGSSFNSTISDVFVSGSVVGKYRAGGLIGQMEKGTITSSHSDANVSSSYGTSIVGGLVGSATSSNTQINFSSSSGPITGGFSVGGLVGLSLSGVLIDSSFSSSEVNGTNDVSYVGGLIGNSGLSGSVVYSSFFYGSLTGSGSNVGALVGGYSGSSDNRILPYCDSSYWDSDVVAVGVDAGPSGCGVGKTTVEIQTPTDNTGIYSRWDSDVWDFGSSSEYPSLRR